MPQATRGARPRPLPPTVGLIAKIYVFRAAIDAGYVWLALIGVLGSVVVVMGGFVGLLVLPPVIGAVISIMALLLIVVATLFGRVVIFATTGRWLQRRFLPRLQSESVTLLLGVGFWVIMASLPYVWPIVIAGLFVVSMGLALTARYRIGWKKPRSHKA